MQLESSVMHLEGCGAITIKCNAVIIKRDAIRIKRATLIIKRNAVMIKRDAVIITRDAVIITRDAVRINGVSVNEESENGGGTHRIASAVAHTPAHPDVYPRPRAHAHARAKTHTRVLQLEVLQSRGASTRGKRGEIAPHVGSGVRPSAADCR
jgi:hypothetical protein